MNRRYSLFGAEAVILIAVTAPLAIAEEMWWYWGVVVLAAFAGWWTTVRRQRPLLTPRTSQLFVIAAAGLFFVEQQWLGAAQPVLALSHFMILVCISKLLARRTYRDHAQLIILSLLLLVVAAIVTGNLLFPVILAVFLTVGLHAIIRFRLTLEAERTDRHNHRIHAGPEPPSTQLPPTGPLQIYHRGGALRRATFVAAATAMTIGTLLFIFFPRVGAGMLGDLDSPVTGHAVTAFADRLDLNHIGPIHESDRTVMHVRVTRADGSTVGPGSPLYFRGTVLEQYHRPGPRVHWRWRRVSRSQTNEQHYRLCPSNDGQLGAWLVDVPKPSYPTDCLIQRYYLEPQDSRCLLSCYPALEVSSRDFQQIRRLVSSHILTVDEPINRNLRYTVVSPLSMSPSLADALARERQQDDVPELLPPDPPLDRQADVLAMIERAVGGVGPIDDPENRLACVRRLEQFLRSEPFAYTLDPPPVPARVEPIGHFLLETRRGHCEYFASALAVMCQLKGIPARVVNGYRTGEYNPVGGFYLVQARHAHAWVEAFIPGRDWITLDPTPARAGDRRAAGTWLPQLRRYLDYLQFQWSNLIIAYDAELRRDLFAQFAAWVRRPMKDQHTALGSLAAFARELFGWRLDLKWHERAVYWVFTLLFLTMVVLIGYVMVVVGWRLSAVVPHALAARAPASARTRETDFYRQFCRRLAHLGLRRRHDQTPAEFANDLAGRADLFNDAPDLIDAYYEVAFGRRRLDPDRRSRIRAFLKRLSRLTESQRQQIAAGNRPG